MVSRHTGGHERLDVCRQVSDGPGPPLPGEIAESEADRNTAPDGLGPVALLRQPGDVSLDLGRDRGDIGTNVALNHRHLPVTDVGAS